MIALSDVRVRRGARVVLGPVNLQLDRRKITALIGPSGAGKSTLLGALSGASIDGGAIECDGARLDTMDAAARGAWARCRAVLSQQHERPFAFALRDFVALGRLPHGDREHPRSAAIVRDALAWAGLDPSLFLQRTIDTLSGGELQRAQLARVRAQLAGEGPRWLFLDEPTAHLDLPLQHQLLERCAALRDEGVGVVVVLHELSLALEWADELVLLREGRVLAQRSTSAVDGALLSECFSAPLAIVRDPARGISMVTVARAVSAASAMQHDDSQKD